MNLSMRDKKILLMFLGVLLFALSFLFVYKPQMEEAAQISANNDSLQERLSQLLDLAQNRELFRFPIEDYYRLAGFDFSRHPYPMLAEHFMAHYNAGEAPQETMMEQGNQKTQDQIDQIEGTDSSLGNDGYSTIDSSNSVQSTIQGDSTGTPALYRTQDTVQFSGTYKSLKEAVKYLADQSGRMTLDNVNASFDSSTGNLTGTMTINIFSMTGGSTSYSAPDAGSTVYGTDNIFGTIENTKKSKKSKKKAAETVAADTEAQQNQEAAQTPADETTDATQSR